MTATARQGLPPKPFFYTLDQVAYLLSVEESYLRQFLLHYEGRSVGVCPKDKIKTIDMSPSDASKAEWRVAETNLIQFMKFKGYRYYERGYVK